MNVAIHRGAAEIGGSAVEVKHGGKRIVLDLGLPLSAALGEDVPLPEIRGLTSRDDDLLAVVLTHSHPDHYGLIGRIAPEVPIIAGAATARILSEAAFFTPSGLVFEPAAVLVDQVPMVIGPFQITPFLVDHSAYDAYALLVDAGGRRLFYTGDLRAHGRKSRLFERLIREPPPNVHALLMEGTRITEDDPTARGLPSEDAVEAEILKTMEATSGLVLAIFSPQNIDRLVSIYRATKKARRILVLDLYGASVALATGRDTIPTASRPDVRVYVPQAQRIKVKEAEAFDRVRSIASKRIYLDEIARTPSRFVALFRESMAREFERAGCLAGAAAIWSMWAGYLQNTSGERLSSFLNEHQIPMSIHHTSGHATLGDLQRLADAIDADQVVPIHTSSPDSFAARVRNVEVRKDGEWWTV